MDLTKTESASSSSMFNNNNDKSPFVVVDGGGIGSSSRNGGTVLDDNMNILRKDIEYRMKDVIDIIINKTYDLLYKTIIIKEEEEGGKENNNNKIIRDNKEFADKSTTTTATTAAVAATLPHPPPPSSTVKGNNMALYSKADDDLKEYIINVLIKKANKREGGKGQLSNNTDDDDADDIDKLLRKWLCYSLPLNDIVIKALINGNYDYCNKILNWLSYNDILDILYTLITRRRTSISVDMVEILLQRLVNNDDNKSMVEVLKKCIEHLINNNNTADAATTATTNNSNNGGGGYDDICDLLKSQLIVAESLVGNTCYREGDYKGAIDSYSTAINTIVTQLLPSSSIPPLHHHRDNIVKLRYNLARALYRQGEWSRAIEECDKCLIIDNSYANARVQRAQCYTALLRFKEAAQDYQILGWASKSAELLRLDEQCDHYTVLRLPHYAGDNDIKSSYRDLARLWHPDKNGHRTNDEIKRCHTWFHRIQESYRVLTDPGERMEYDLLLRRTGSGAGAGGGINDNITIYNITPTPPSTPSHYFNKNKGNNNDIIKGGCKERRYHIFTVNNEQEDEQDEEKGTGTGKEGYNNNKSYNEYKYTGINRKVNVGSSSIQGTLSGFKARMSEAFSNRNECGGGGGGRSSKWIVGRSRRKRSGINNMNNNNNRPFHNRYTGKQEGEEEEKEEEEGTIRSDDDEVMMNSNDMNINDDDAVDGFCNENNDGGENLIFRQWWQPSSPITRTTRRRETIHTNNNNNPTSSTSNIRFSRVFDNRRQTSGGAVGGKYNDDMKD